MVFYRKYRPQTLEELAGQLPVKQALQAALSANKLAHAYLFCGPKGTGKTSTARILAKMANCESQTANPCNQCASCLSITDGSNLDVIEMDAASNRGIEDIRNLRENIKLSPSSSKKKVYIIDEVHMLSNDAFNALLKTLEEPPEHVLFILATTEVQKIPQTILSRVQRLDFKPATVEDLAQVLKNIAAKEKIDIEDEALLALAKKAQGSFRDAEKYLDQLSSLGKIDLGAIENNLGLGVFEELVGLLEKIAENKLSLALEQLSKQASEGVNLREFNLSLLDTLRQLLFIKNDLGEQLVKPEIGEEKYQLLKNLSSKFTLEKLIYLLDCFQTSLEQSRYVSIISLPLEVAIVKGCRMGVKDREPEKKSEEVKEEKTATPVKKDAQPEVRTEEIESYSSETCPSEDIQKIVEKWSYILETVRQNNYSLEALLRSAKIKECKEKTVAVEVPYSFHQRILEAPKSRDLLESILSDILGRTVKVSAVLGQKPTTREELANVEVAADDEIVRIAAEIFNSDQVN